MAYEMKDGQGSLFRVPEEKKVERGPDYEGKCVIDGQAYRIAGWIKTSTAAGKWLSLKLEVPRQAEAPPKRKAIDPDADIPF